MRLRSLSRCAYVFAGGFVSLALLSGLACVTRAPFVFPSLGPTAFLFFASPSAPHASPRNALLGHAIGLACGYGALWVTGLEQAPSALIAGVDLPRVLAAALSMALTGGLMLLFNVPHPPAGATTLIVSLGTLTRPSHLAAVEVAVALLTLVAWVVNRIAGVPSPTWAAAAPDAAQGT